MVYLAGYSWSKRHPAQEEQAKRQRLQRIKPNCRRLFCYGCSSSFPPRVVFPPRPFCRHHRSCLPWCRWFSLDRSLGLHERHGIHEFREDQVLLSYLCLLVGGLLRGSKQHAAARTAEGGALAGDNETIDRIKGGAGPETSSRLRKKAHSVCVVNSPFYQTSTSRLHAFLKGEAVHVEQATMGLKTHGKHATTNTDRDDLREHTERSAWCEPIARNSTCRNQQPAANQLLMRCVG